MKNGTNGNYTGEYGDYMEAYDDEYAFEPEYDDDENELKESDEPAPSFTAAPEDEELIDAYYEYLGLVRCKTDKDGNAIKHDVCDENLRAIFSAYRDGDDETKNIAACLIEHKLRNLVPSIAHKHYPTYMASKQEANDLLSCGWEGVFKVAASYDPDRAAPSTFFYRHILHEMDEYIKQFVHKSTSYNIRISNKIRKATDALALRGIRNPSVMDIAYETGLKTSVIRNAMGCQSCRESRSLDDMVIDPGEYSRAGKSTRSREDYDQLCRNTACDFNNPLAIVCDKEDSRVIMRALNSLPVLQKEVLCRLYGVNHQRQTYTEIFRELGIPTDQIKIIEAQGKKALGQNAELCRAYNGGRAVETKHELNLEPVAFTPDAVGLSLMNALEGIEIIDY